MLPLIVSVLSLVVSGLALFATVRLHRRTRSDANMHHNLESMISVERVWRESPELLRFHGITESDLAEHSVTAGELTYLVNSFAAGRMFYRESLDRSDTFPPDSYRYKMLETPEVRNAWPLVRRLVSPSTYRDTVDRTVAMLDASAGSAESSAAREAIKH
jgi:hypothetical protein